MQKRKPIKSKAVRDSARGESCTLNIPSICNYDDSTTILAHLPDESGTGKMGGKSSDLIAVYACSDCHSYIDGGYSQHRFSDMLKDWEYDSDYYLLRALKRTITALCDKGIIMVKGGSK